MTMKEKLATILLLAMISTTLSAQQYQSSHIARAAMKISLDTTALEPGITYPVVDGHRLVVRVGTNKSVEHIGIPLFTEQMRVLQPSPIYDYLENAVMEHTFSITGNVQREKNLQFLTGNWQTLEHLGDTLVCTIQNLDDKRYVVSWQRDGQEVAKVSFPISYDLLANSTRREMETNFVRDIRQFKSQTVAPEVVDSLPLATADTLKPGIYPTVGQDYLTNSISNRLYVQVDKDGDRHLVRDKRYVAESLANLLLCPEPSDGDVRMVLSVRKSDYHTDSLETTAHTFLDFCKAQGCKPFFGFEGIRGGIASATLIMTNKASGYDHVAHVNVDTGTIDSDDCVLHATIFLFTPTHNISSLFGTKANANNSNSIIIWK